MGRTWPHCKHNVLSGSVRPIGRNLNRFLSEVKCASISGDSEATQGRLQVDPETTGKRPGNHPTTTKDPFLFDRTYIPLYDRQNDGLKENRTLESFVPRAENSTNRTLVSQLNGNIDKICMW